MFTAAELEEIRLADIEIDREFDQKKRKSTKARKRPAPVAVSDKQDWLTRWAQKRQKLYAATYYAAHREEIAAYHAACYREQKAERDAHHKAYLDMHRKEWNAYQCEYRRRKKSEL